MRWLYRRLLQSFDDSRHARINTEIIMAKMDELDQSIIDLQTTVESEHAELDEQVKALADLAAQNNVSQSDIDARVARIRAITQGIKDKVAALNAPPAGQAGGQAADQGDGTGTGTGTGAAGAGVGDNGGAGTNNTSGATSDTGGVRE